MASELRERVRDDLTVNVNYREGNEVTRPSNITDLHVERGQQFRAIVRHDIVARGMSFESAVAALAEYLGIDAQSVALGIAIANEWEG